MLSLLLPTPVISFSGHSCYVLGLYIFYNFDKLEKGILRLNCCFNGPLE